MRFSNAMRRAFSQTALMLGILGFADAASAGYGYVWASQPTATSVYTASGSYSYNSSGGSNRIQRTGMGRYTVTMPGIATGAGGGNVQVTAYGDVTNHCKVRRWDRIGSDFSVQVACFSRSGLPVDQRFTALMVQGSTSWSGPGISAYFRSFNRTFATAHAPNSFYHFNSAGGGASVRRRTIGLYEVFVSTPTATPRFRNATVNVTAVGSDDARCSVRDKDGADSLNRFGFDVECTRGNGSPIDSQFDVAVTERTTSIPGHAGGAMQALFYGSWSSAGSSPRHVRSSSDPTLAHIQFPGLANGGTVIANGGVHGYYCNVIRWYWSSAIGGTQVDVRCRDRFHAPVAIDFDIQFLSKPLYPFVLEPPPVYVPPWWDHGILW